MALVCPPSAMKTAAARALSFQPVRVVAVSLLMAILLGNGAVMDGAQHAPPWMDMSEFTAFGSVCSPDDMVAVLSPDKKSFTIIFHKLRACMPGTNEEKESFCEVAFHVKFPPGWSYTIGTVTAKGFAKLDDGVRFIHHLSARISGTGTTARTMYAIDGPCKGNFEITPTSSVEVNSACDDDRHLNIQSQVRVAGPEDAKCIITTVQVVYQTIWKKC